MPIKYLPDRTKFLRSIIALIIKEGDCYDAWKIVARHFENGSYHIQGMYFDQYYIPVAHADYFKTNISIEAMHRLTAMFPLKIDDGPFLFNAWMEYGEQNQLGGNIINSLMQWLKWWNIRKVQLVMLSKPMSSLMEVCHILRFYW